MVSFDIGFRGFEKLGLSFKACKTEFCYVLVASTLARLMIVVRPLESVHQNNLTRILLIIVDGASINFEHKAHFMYRSVRGQDSDDSSQSSGSEFPFCWALSF